MPFRRPVVLGISLAAALPLAVLAAPASAATAPARPYDLNGDGRPELVVGVPHLTVGQANDAGGIAVYPATGARLAAQPQVVTATAAGGTTVAGATFGNQVVSADVDRDGFADLVVAAWQQDAGDVQFAGTVTVVHGSATGLEPRRTQVLRDPAGPIEDGHFGWSMALGDFDHDGWPDLAVGAPGADPGQPDSHGSRPSGTVTVFAGRRAGFSSSRSVVLHGVRAKPDDDDGFGTSLAVADLNQDGTDDLVVETPGETSYDSTGDENPGALSICDGGPRGLQGCARVVRDHLFAAGSVTVGNVSGSSRPEIVVGAPDPDPDRVHGLKHGGGVVSVVSLKGTGSSTTTTTQRITFASRGVPGRQQPDDGFGTAVALGDLDHDGYADLLVGAPGADVGKQREAGKVVLLRGGKSGYRTSGAKTYDQSTTGVPGKAESDDHLGSALSLLDHDADGHLDLAVGAPGENDADGAVTTLRGSGHSFTTTKSRTFGLDDPRYPDGLRASFGDVLGR